MICQNCMTEIADQRVFFTVQDLKTLRYGKPVQIDYCNGCLEEFNAALELHNQVKNLR